jgi:sulfotransferase
VADAFEKIFFISGLPRSGSTLLGSILRQNPALCAGMTSPMYSLVNGLLPRLSNANEFNAFISDEARLRLLRGLFHNFYADLGGRIVVDTNRHWTSKLSLLLQLFPQTRFVCCVRSIPEVVQSFEALFAARPAEISRMMNFEPETNVYTRADHLMTGAGVVGFPLNALKEAFFGPWSDRLMLISYANLCARPDEVLKGVYEFLQLEGFAHDFGEVAFDADAYDRGLGLPGLHRIRQTVKAEPPELSLPPDLIARLAGPYFWEIAQPGTRSHLAFARSVAAPAARRPVPAA